jgi:hypothetical protein
MNLLCKPRNASHIVSDFIFFTWLMQCRVRTLTWDSEESILYIGGFFHGLDNVTISTGLAMWSRPTGLIGFPGGGVSNYEGLASSCFVQSIAFEPISKVHSPISTVFLPHHSHIPFTAVALHLWQLPARRW